MTETDERRRVRRSEATPVRRPVPTRRRLSVLAAAFLLVPLGSCRPDAQPVGTDPLPTAVPSGRLGSAGSAGSVTATAESPSSVLLITTDDQNVSDLEAMPQTRRLLKAHGMQFREALSPHPLCCPARAEILTGQYAQNNGVQHNRGPFGGFSRLDPSETLGTWMQAAGYHTAYTGKYLNGYGSDSPRPPGWEIWDPMVARLYKYWGTPFELPRVGDEQRYSVDAVADRTVDYLRRFAADERPFFVWSSHVAPHATAGPHDSWDPPRTPTGYPPMQRTRAPALDRPSFTTRPEWDPTCVCDRTSWTRAYVQRFHEARQRSLQAVDMAVARAVRVLVDTGRIDDTYVFFTTDNGLLMGEHGYFGKSTLYEENLRIPFLVRGPGVAPHSSSRLPVALTDLAPTILDIAGIQGFERLDGRSFLPTLHGRSQTWRDTQLVQTGSRARRTFTSGWGYRGVRTSRYTYGIQPDTGFELLLDRKLNPYQRENHASDSAYGSVLTELRHRTSLLRSCTGVTCSVRFGPVPALTTRAHAVGAR